MKLRSAPFQNYSLPLFDTDEAIAAAAAAEAAAKAATKRPDLPPSKHDGDLPKQDTFDRAYVEELRSENKTWRSKMVSERTAREAAEKERDDAKKAADTAKKDADTEANGKVTEAEKRANDRVIRAELKVAAQKAGMIDLDVLKLVDLSSIKLTEAGEVEGAEALMTKLKEDKPHFFGTPAKGSSNPEKPPKPEDGTPKKAKDMTEEERAAFLKEHKKKTG